MIDLCKVLGVEEGEEFKFGEKRSIKYRIYNGELNCTYINCENDWSKSHLELNEISGAKVIKLPKKKEFTDDELCILRNIDKEYKWIARDEEDGGICIFIEKPLRKEHLWDFKRSSHYIEFHCYNHLFNSITWEDEEPVYIDDYVERGVE
jgi:hypothetical protein